MITTLFFFFFTNSIVVLVKMTTEQLEFHSVSYRCTMGFFLFFFLKGKLLLCRLRVPVSNLS